MHRTYLYTDMSIVFNMHEKKKTESSLYTCIQSTLLSCMEQSAGTDVFLSLFGGLCSQTASPLLLCIWLARMAKGKGYKCRVGASLHFLSFFYAVSTSGRFLTL